MKKLYFLLLFFIFTSSVAKSQNITYTPFFRDNSYQSQPQPHIQKQRATAYYVDDNKNYRKIPIIVTVTTYMHPTGNTSQDIKVTSYYSGFRRNWVDCIQSAPVQQCQSIGGNQMEQSFMFKANLMMIGGIYCIYFDL